MSSPDLWTAPCPRERKLLQGSRRETWLMTPGETYREPELRAG